MLSLEHFEERMPESSASARKGSNVDLESMKLTSQHCVLQCIVLQVGVAQKCILRNYIS